MNKLYLTVLIVVVLVITAWLAGLVRVNRSSVTLGSVSQSTVVTNSSSTVGAGIVVKILSENTGAQSRTISNVSGGVTTYLSFKTASSGLSALSGYALYPSSTLEMSDVKGNLWTGNVWGLTQSGTSTISTSEL